MANRLQRRQGVVYGPARPPDSGRGSGAILGRLLGAFVVVVAVGVLGAGALAFMSANDGPTRSPSPSAIARATGPTLPPAPTPGSDETPAAPSPPPTATSSPAPSAETTPFVPQVQVGPGYVTFGTKTNSQLRVTDPQSAFDIDQRMRWSAHLTQPANSAELRVHVSKADAAAEGGERLIRDEEVKPRVTGAQIFAKTLRPSRYLEGPGLYVVRYVRGEEVMAVGSFLIED